MTDKKVIGVFIPVSDQIAYRDQRKEQKGDIGIILEAISQSTVIDAHELLPSYMENEKKRQHKEFDVYVNDDVHELYSAVQKKLTEKRRETLNIMASSKLLKSNGGLHEKIRLINQRFEENKKKFKH
jgi:hypothetical protein